jgi:hypothetical protein
MEMMRARLRIPRFAKQHSCAGALRWNECRRKGFATVLFMLFWGLVSQGYAAESLECPEIGSVSVPDLIGDAAGGGMTISENRFDLANEINDAINRLQTSDPAISSNTMQDVLIAAYCRVVVRAGGLTAAEKWSRMRQFDSVLQQQVAANTMPPGTLIIANVPLPPVVFRELRSRAAASHQTTAQLMAAVLERAAGQ